MHSLLQILLALSATRSTPPVERVWIRTPAPFHGPIAPEVQSLEITATTVTVRSAGVSLAYLGPLQASPQPPDSVRQFAFALPRNPRPAAAAHLHVPPDVEGVFINGVPVYNQFETLSYQGQNLWHFDAVALRLKGEAPSGLLEALLPDANRHSPILGYALDGYPIYGPWAFDAVGTLHRMRSSYRVRTIAERTSWPDGTKLAPGQYGPPVTHEFPLGTFAEDYEYIAGSGDLDQFNGRVAITPEYPQGTYAYFLTSDAAGKPAFPYLLASHYYGAISTPPSPELAQIASRKNVTLHTTALTAGRPAMLRLTMPARTLEYVHEKPIHMMIVSADLNGFDHIHPELTATGDWDVSYTFPRGGKYRIYLEFTLPGKGSRVEFFDVTAAGDPTTPLPPKPAHLGVTLNSAVLRAGQDTELRFTLTHADALEPYLGAWAHFAVVGAGFSSFLHAHPLGDAPEPLVHSHTAVAGPPPAELRTLVSFAKPGTYKLWAQFQVAGQVEVMPFVLHVEAAPSQTAPPAVAPKGAIHIAITASGYEPARIEAPAGSPLKLWFTRTGEPNCGAKVVFPALGLTRDVPLGGSALVEIPAPPSGELRFTCGMGMDRGLIVVR